MSMFEAWPAALLVGSGLLGLVVGSFLNVVAYRWPIMFRREWRASCAELAREEAAATKQGADPESAAVGASADATGETRERFDLWWPPSTCPHCGMRIAAQHNIPVLGYLLLKGRCAQCAAPISWRYPLVEAFTGGVSVAVAAQFGPSLATAAALVLTWFLIALSLIDLDEQMLPDSMTLPLIWLGLLVSLIPTPAGPIFADLHSSVIGAVAGYLALWSVYHGFKLVTGKEGMGYGDFKLLAALGAWLGWQKLPVVILLSAGAGTIVILALILLGGRPKDKPTPFGPFLAVGGWIALPWGETLMARFVNVSFVVVTGIESLLGRLTGLLD